jgi:RNA-directed DNA polymerase
MRRECHVRFSEGGGVKPPSATRPVVGFQHESDARRFRDAMRDRLREFSLSLHPDKTRLIEFGRFAAQNCKRRGRSKPETFKFLGFVLICDKIRRGDFRIRRKSRRDRMCAKLREIKEALRHRMHRPIVKPGNGSRKSSPDISLTTPCRQQPGAERVSIPRTGSLASAAMSAQPKNETALDANDETGRRVPSPTASPASLAQCALRRQTPEVGAECPNWARSDLCGGRSAMSVPTANIKVGGLKRLSFFDAHC